MIVPAAKDTQRPRGLNGRGGGANALARSVDRVEALITPFTTLVNPPYTCYMATAVKKLDLHIGELVEIEGRRYEVVPDKTGGLTIEPPITPIAELYENRGMKPASAEDFERIAGDLPTDGEG